jgi:hypothetical protein
MAINELVETRRCDFSAESKTGKVHENRLPRKNAEHVQVPLSTAVLPET